MKQSQRYAQPGDEYFMRKTGSAKNNSENKKFDSLPPSGQRVNQPQEQHAMVMTSAQQLIEQQRIFNQLQVMFNKNQSKTSATKR
jgi:hypothetical protein